jgi:hypothetical protein
MPMMNAKCPSCHTAISNVNLEPGPLGNSFSGPMVNGYAALRPICRAVLGVLPDPANIAEMVALRLTKPK